MGPNVRARPDLILKLPQAKNQPKSDWTKLTRPMSTPTVISYLESTGKNLFFYQLEIRIQN